MLNVKKHMLKNPIQNLPILLGPPVYSAKDVKDFVDDRKKKGLGFYRFSSEPFIKVVVHNVGISLDRDDSCPESHAYIKLHDSSGERLCYCKMDRYNALRIRGLRENDWVHSATLVHFPRSDETYLTSAEKSGKDERGNRERVYHPRLAIV